INGFIPEGRGGHVATIFQNQIYFMGGARIIPSTNPIRSPTRVYNLSDQVFFLDLSSSFSTSNPPYVDLSETSARMTYGFEKGAAVVGGPANDNVYLVEGIQQDLSLLNKIDKNVTITSNQTLMYNELLKTWNVTNNTIFMYNLREKYWTIPKPIGVPPSIRRRSASTVIDKDGTKIYMFGGRADTSTGSPIFIIFNDLYTYDTILSKWETINVTENAPISRRPTSPVNMDEIAVFDTNSLKWSNKHAENASRIQPRVGHTATLSQDKTSIIIIGGTTASIIGLRITAYPIFILLDISTEPYKYSELNDSGERPRPLAYHTVNLYQNYMIVAFGNITDEVYESNNTSSTIYLLDMPCLKWVTTFIPNNTSCPPQTLLQPSPQSTPIGVIIGTTIAAIIFVVLLIAAILYIRRRRKSRKDILEIGPDQPRNELLD
ncbi:14777_t:CDS:2, partial [Racocetra persica]